MISHREVSRQALLLPLHSLHGSGQRIHTSSGLERERAREIVVKRKNSRKRAQEKDQESKIGRERELYWESKQERPLKRKSLRARAQDRELMRENSRIRAQERLVGGAIPCRGLMDLGWDMCIATWTLVTKALRMLS